MSIAKKVEAILADIIKKYGIKLSPEIYNWEWETASWGGKELKINFNDDALCGFLAGYVSEKVYDEWEKAIEAIGYEIVDTDGSTLLLTHI